MPQNKDGRFSLKEPIVKINSIIPLSDYILKLKEALVDPEKRKGRSIDEIQEMLNICERADKIPY